MCYDTSNAKVIPVLLSTEVIHMARPSIPLNVEDLVARYREGECVTDLAEKFNVPHTPIQDRLRKAGVLRKIAEDLNRYKRESMIDLPLDELLDRYRRGESAISISRYYKVSTIVIRRRLLDAGLFSRHGSGDQPVSLARTAELRSHNIGSGERWLAQVIKSAGMRIRAQAAIYRYNIDMLVNDTVAVELITCSGTPYSASRYRKRIEYLLDRYCLLIVWSFGRHTLTPIGAKKTTSILKTLCTNPAKSRGQYWVIRGDGELASCGDNSNDVTFVPATV